MVPSYPNRRYPESQTLNHENPFLSECRGSLESHDRYERKVRRRIGSNWGGAGSSWAAGVAELRGRHRE